MRVKKHKPPLYLKNPAVSLQKSGENRIEVKIENILEYLVFQYKEDVNSLSSILKRLKQKKFPVVEPKNQHEKRILDTLVSYGLFVRIDAVGHPLQDLLFFSKYTSKPQEILQELAHLKVGVVAFDGILHQKLAELLDVYSLQTTYLPGDENPDCPSDIAVLVLLHTGKNYRQVLDWHDRCWKKRKQIFYAEARGEMIWLGPWIVPSETACLRCIESRIEESDVSRSQTLVLQPDPGSEGFTGPSVLLDVWLSMVGYFLLTHLSGVQDFLQNRVIHLSLSDGIFNRFFVLRSPRCPLCGGTMYGHFTKV